MIGKANLKSAKHCFSSTYRHVFNTIIPTRHHILVSSSYIDFMALLSGFNWIAAFFSCPLVLWGQPLTRMLWREGFSFCTKPLEAVNTWPQFLTNNTTSPEKCFVFVDYLKAMPIFGSVLLICHCFPSYSDVSHIIKGTVEFRCITDNKTFTSYLMFSLQTVAFYIKTEHASWLE